MDLRLNSLRVFFGDLSQIHLESWSSEDVKTPFEIKPKEFLSFAEYDLNNNYGHNLVNALSNIKRAIDCQLDSLLFSFGLYEESKTQKLNFPQKIRWMNSLGIISPRILKKINKKRNLLEHEFVSPSKEAVEDALDISTLFIAYTDKFLLLAMYDCEPYHDEKKDSFEFKLDYEKKCITVAQRVWDGKAWVRDDDGEIKRDTIDIPSNSNEYFDFLKVFLSLYSLRK